MQSSVVGESDLGTSGRDQAATTILPKFKRNARVTKASKLDGSSSNQLPPMAHPSQASN